ncbi:MAG TPA: carboxypeptidase regulatory-like domain-containing protein [Bryobacteraceae bacterium]|nr:carboxypeptidase regulatory-like domain-containing protein [Bryobacteraceae bacterium]
MKLLHILLAISILSLPLCAQTATLRGQVTDESGAVVPGATLTLTGPGGLSKVTTSAGDGSYAFIGLPPGNYAVRASAPDLIQAQALKLVLKTGLQNVNVQMKVASVTQQVTVQDSAGPSVSTDPSSNSTATVLRGEDLQALSDDPDDLQADLQALAGPAAGPEGGEIFIDGFSGGQLPSKDSIREVRINQNPFSPEFDKLGYGRIEILTKPGTDKLHGQGFFNFGDDVFNSRNPYAQQKAPFLLQEYGGTVSGPLGKRASFFLDAERRAIDNGSVIDAFTLDQSTEAIGPYTSVLLAPQRRLRISPRLDYQLSKNHTLMFRYGFTRNDVRDQGIGNFNLPSRGYFTLDQNQTVQITDTAVLGPSTVNETRFQFFHVENDQIADSFAPALLVLGAFNGGGAQTGRAFDTENHYELQNYTSIIKGAHTWKFGVRTRGVTIGNISPQNFGGTFTFGGGLAPELNAENQEVLDSSGQPALVPITSIQQYQRTLLGLPGGGATQFSIAAGIPFLAVDQVDVGAFVGDDWRVRPNVTLSLGLRYETQTNIHDWRDVAPRFGFAWAPGAKQMSLHPKVVIRGGFGMFYSRFDVSNIETAERYNGIVQQQYILNNPSFFPVVPSIAQLLAMPGIQSTQTVQELSSRLRAPYIMQSALSVERQLAKDTTLSVTYTNSHGLHMLRSEEFNAPGPIYLMESSGLYNQNQLIANVNARLNPNMSLFGYYTFNHAMSNTDGLSTFPAVPYSMAGEYGPAATDIRHRAFIGGSLNTKWNVRLSPFIVVQSGAPYNVTIGQDIYGDTLFNARPGIPTDLTKPGLIDTMYGWLDPNPTPGEAILPRNFGRGPGQITVNLRLAKTFGFGPEREGAAGGGGGPMGAGHNAGFHSIFADTPTSRRYNLTASISARNLLNHVNEGPIIGQITSPLFGEANQVAGGFGAFAETANNRRLELQLRFMF